MSWKFVAALFAVVLAIVPAAACADDVHVYAGQPGVYEVRQYLVRPDSFGRQPYFATHPPVYYSGHRLDRTYGWTPYPYLGTTYPEAPNGKAEANNGKSLLPKRSGTKSGRVATR